MKSNTKNLLLIIINVFLLVSTIVLTYMGVINGAGDGQVGENMTGGGYFKAFTIDSNILMGIIAGIMLFFNIKNLSKKQDNMPKWVEILYLIGTSAVALTFVTVVIFLAPMFEMKGDGYFTMFTGQMLFFHLINPILAIIVFVCLTNKNKLTLKETFLGIIPTCVYSIVYLICVAIVKCWSDFYNFTFGGKMYLIPIVLIVMYGVSFSISWLLVKFHNKLVKE